MISSLPEVASFPTESYSLLLLGTDGLFEAFSPEEVHSRFREVGPEGWSGFGSLLAK